jgi:hypothetical protein
MKLSWDVSINAAASLALIRAEEISDKLID